MVAVIGEALIDLVQQPATGGGARTFVAHSGGSPLNVAVGLRRLGRPTRLFARLATDAFGRQLAAYARDNDLDLSGSVEAAEPSTLAVVGLDETGSARYDFYVEQTADWQWNAPELRGLSTATDWVHTGSLASWTAPGCEVIAAALADLPAGTILSYDPNVRPALMPDRPTALHRVEGLIARADVVKASDEDVRWLYPDAELPDVLTRWARSGPALVVITCGADGAIAAQACGRLLTRPGRAVQVVDTVGAGDSFMAALINAVLDTETAPAELGSEQVTHAIDEAILASSLTCQRAGADPPTAAELRAALTGSA